MTARGKGALRIAIEDFLETFSFGKAAAAVLEHVAEIWEDALMDVYASLAERFELADKLPPALQPTNLRTVVKTSQSGVVLSIGAVIGLALGGIFGATQPFSRMASYWVDGAYRSYRSSPSELYQIARRSGMAESELQQYLKDLGTPDDISAGYAEATRPTLNSGELERVRLKKLISNSSYTEELHKQGWSDERIAQVQALYKQLPGAGDLISMAVREAFDPEIVSKLGYLQDFPPELGEYLEQQGYDRAWAERYWAAHWQLPSLQQGFEMLHRLRPEVTDNPFTAEDMSQLLRIQDIAPFFRERLMEISYNPLTRVDVRRMYAMGVLTEDEVYANYLDLGYNAENAERMTQFTIRYERNEERGLTRDAIQGSYKRGISSRETAISQLGELGYNTETADFFIDIVDYDIQSETSDAQLAAIKARYLQGLLTDSTVTDPLGKLNLPGERATALLELWKVQRDSQIQTPSRTDLDDFYRRSLITPEQYASYLALQGYSPDSVTLYSQRIDLIAQEEAAYELETAQTEQERLRSSKLSTTYQRDLAALNVSAAEVRAAIAALKVASYDIEDAEQLEDNARLLLQYTAYIAQLNLQKAQLAYTYRSEKLTPEV